MPSWYILPCGAHLSSPRQSIHRKQKAIASFGNYCCNHLLPYAHFNNSICTDFCNPQYPTLFTIGSPKIS